MSGLIVFHCTDCNRYWPDLPGDDEGEVPAFVMSWTCLACRRRRMPVDQEHDHPERRHADRRTESPGLGGVPGLDRRHDRRRGDDR